MNRRRDDERRGAVLLRVAPLVVVLLLAALVAGVAAYDARERAHARSERIAQIEAIQFDQCERGNVLRRTLAQILRDARELRRNAGTMTPEIEDLFVRRIAEVGPIDCAEATPAR